MARVTVEDCIDKIDNRFKLVLIAAKRAREISAGAPPTVDKKKDRDKNPVVALREIAAESIDIGEVNDGLVKSLQQLTRPEASQVQNQDQNQGTASDSPDQTQTGEGASRDNAERKAEAEDIARYDIASFTAPPSDAGLEGAMEIHDREVAGGEGVRDVGEEAEDAGGGSFADVADDADDDEAR